MTTPRPDITPASLALLLALTLLMGACAGPREITRESRQRDYTSPCEKERASFKPTDGSLYTPGTEMLFVDRRAYRECDIVTIRIAERSSAAGSANTELSRQTEVNARIDAFMGLLDKLEDLNGRIDPTGLVDAATEYTFKGSGSTRRQGSLNATVTAYVRRVLPNGHLFVEGTKTILVNEEEQYFYISGVIRQVDIDGVNAIDSNLMSDVQVEFTGQGAVSDANKQGWFGRWFGWLWPF